MTVDAETARSVAAALRSAEIDGTSTPLVSAIVPDLDWDGSRLIALERDRLRLADGDVCIGYKLGWTSAAMREVLGIDRPNWGTLWRSQLLDGALDPRLLRHAKVEPEIVYRAGRRLSGAETTSVDALAAADGWSVGVEVVAPRWPSFDFTWLDNTADNSSAHAVAIGPTACLDGDPAEADIEFSDGSDVRTGRGELAMGSPAEAVAWLVRSLAEEGRSLEAGDLVFTGGVTKPFDIAAASSYTVRSPQLGALRLDVDPRPSTPPVE